MKKKLKRRRVRKSDWQPVRKTGRHPWSKLVAMAGVFGAGIVAWMHPEGTIGEVTLELLKGAIGGAIIGLGSVACRNFVAL